MITNKLKHKKNQLELNILIAGVILSIFYLFLLAMSSIFLPNSFQAVIGLTATHIIFGRAAGISFGYAFDLGHLIVIPTAMIIETIIVLLIYPLIILSINKLLHFKKLDSFINSITRSAKKNEKTIKKYGPLGLFAFVLFPFWMTGPLIGSIIGYFLGFSHLKNLTIVIVSTCFAIAGWAFLLKTIHNKAVVYSPFAPFIIILLLAAAVLLFNIISRNKK